MKDTVIKSVAIAACEYFPGVFVITCADDKVVKVSRMQRENKLTSAT